MNEMPIIIGGNHHNTLGVIRALGYKGIHSHVLLITDEEKPYVAYSRYIGKCVILRDKQEIVPFLKEYAKSIQNKEVIFSCADFVTSELDASYNQLKEYFYLPTANEQGVCNHYMDKDTMATLAKKVGIEIPKSWIVEGDMELDVQKVDIPCIVKPLASIYGSKADIRILREANSLVQYLAENKGRRFFVQEFIEKDFEYQLIGCSLNYGKEIVIPGYSKCIRPCPGTNTGFLEYRPFDDFDCNLHACREFIKCIGYQGLFSMEYLRDKNGKDYFMEINMRNDGNGICVTCAGINLPYIWYQYCKGRDYKNEIANNVKDVFVMPEFDELRLVANRHLGLRDWIKDIYRTNRFMEYDKNDICPFLCLLYKILKRKIC